MRSLSINFVRIHRQNEVSLALSPKTKCVGSHQLPPLKCRTHSGQPYRSFLTRNRVHQNSHRCHNHRRTFFTDSLPAFLVPPVIFTSLLLGLWAYKCLMTVIFQDKIIYIPYMPPFARSEKMDDHLSACAPVQWQFERIKSLDGTKLALCIGRLPSKQPPEDLPGKRRPKEVVICYFQGNGGSTPPRLPILSNVLKVIQSRHIPSDSSVSFSVIALSYRGYWKSSGRASQRGIEQDAQALLQHLPSLYSADSDIQIVMWGQSIGAGIAATATARYLATTRSHIPISALILETPFTNIKTMLFALYPQKWLPYQYLWPFLWNHWDSEVALRDVAQALPEHRPKVLLVAATRDEVVPKEEADKIERLCKDLNLETSRQDVVGALHTDATIRREGQEIIGTFIFDNTASNRPSKSNGSI